MLTTGILAIYVGTTVLSPGLDRKSSAPLEPGATIQVPAITARPPE